MKQRNMFKKAWWYLFLITLTWQARYFFFVGNNEYSSYSLFAVDIILLVLLFLYRKDWSIFLISSWQKKSWWLYALMLFDFSIFLSIFWAGDHGLALYKYSHVVVGELLFLLATVVFKKDFYRSAYFFLGGALAQSLLAVGQFARQGISPSTILGVAAHDPYVLGTAVLEIGSRILRAYGTLSHPNVLGGFLAVSLVLTFYLWLKREEQSYFKKEARLFTLFFISTFSFIFTALLLSFSRAALLAAAVATLFLSIKFYKNIWPKENILRFFIGLILLIFLSFWLAIGSLYLNRFSSDNRLEIISSSERLSSLVVSKDIIESNIVGVGAGNYAKYLENIYQEQPGFVYQPVHNVFLLMAAESGIWTPLFFIAFVFLLLFKKKKPLLGSLSLLLLVLFLFDHWLFSLPFGIGFLFLCLALGNGVTLLQKD